MRYLAETGLLSLKLGRRKMMPFEQWGEEAKMQSGTERERKSPLYSLSHGQMDSEHFCALINQYPSLYINGTTKL
uniref:Uncharacterized protein n=1 Tax=Anguilla anguilla TaxID=7936 RepID=A0A0E9U5Z7_ANGAN